MQSFKNLAERTFDEAFAKIVHTKLDQIRLLRHNLPVSVKSKNAQHRAILTKIEMPPIYATTPWLIPVHLKMAHRCRLKEGVHSITTFFRAYKCTYIHYYAHINVYLHILTRVIM